MAFTGFGKGALAFYDDLAANNSREWWLANKARYEDEVRRPMEELLQDVAEEFGEAKLFRPNRDTRFSKDKTPYKTNIAAVIYQEGGGSVYVSLAAEGLHVGGGSYHLERPQLARLREAIDDDRTGKQLERIVTDAAQGQGRRHRPRRGEDRAPRLLPRPPPHRPAPPRRPRRPCSPTSPPPGSTPPRPRTASSTAGTSSNP